MVVQDVGHRGKDMNSPKKDLVDNKCSSLSNSPHRGCHLQMQLVSLHNSLDTLPFFGRTLLHLLHTENFPAHIVDHPFSTPTQFCIRLQNSAGQMMQGLRICPHYEKYLMTNWILMVTERNHWTCAGRMPNPQSA